MKNDMQYLTRLYGTPYGINGERGDNTVDPKSYAIKALNAGQRLDVFSTSDLDQAKPIRRFRHFGDRLPVEVNID